MSGREKVIKGLGCCASMNGSACRECPYSSECVAGETEYQTGTAHLAADALALLKEQESVMLENQHKPYGNSLNTNAPWISRCPKCGKKVEGKQTRYCKYCGQAVKWDDKG